MGDCYTDQEQAIKLLVGFFRASARPFIPLKRINNYVNGMVLESIQNPTQQPLYSADRYKIPDKVKIRPLNRSGRFIGGLELFLEELKSNAKKVNLADESIPALIEQIDVACDELGFTGDGKKALLKRIEKALTAPKKIHPIVASFDYEYWNMVRGSLQEILNSHGINIPLHKEYLQWKLSSDKHGEIDYPRNLLFSISINLSSLEFPIPAKTVKAVILDFTQYMQRVNGEEALPIQDLSFIKELHTILVQHQPQQNQGQAISHVESLVIKSEIQTQTL